MKKRVLQLIGSFHQGGSEKQAVALTRGMREEGSYDVVVAALNNDGVLRVEIEDDDIPEFVLTSFYDLNFVRQVRKCAAFMAGNRIELIHAHDFYTNVFGMAAATIASTGARVASKRETFGMRSRRQDLVEGIALGRADAVVVNSEAVRGMLIERSIQDEKIRTIYNSVDLERFDRAIELSEFESLGLPAGKRFITLVANLRHQVKNVPMFLRTAKRVLARVPDAHFVIAGEGELESGLRDLAAGLGVEGAVTFMGRCSSVPALLYNSYACVLTSNAEGFSNSILEYMAAGRPVVATNVGGAKEAIIHQENGFLVQPNDDARMAEYLVDLLNNESKAIEFGRAGRKLVSEQFSKKAQIDATLDLYDSLLGKR